VIPWNISDHQRRFCFTKTSLTHIQMEIPENCPHYFNISLKVILENEKGEILGLKCRDDGSLAGFYDFPGGRINSDELDVPYDQVIARELAEEVGSGVRYEGDFIHPVSTGKFIYFSRTLGRENSILQLFFKARYLGGEIFISDEHSGYDWLDLRTDPAEKYFTSGFLEGVKGYLENKD